jgi:hypothetical protein
MTHCHALPAAGSAKGQMVFRSILAVLSMSIAWAGSVGMAQGQGIKVPSGVTGSAAAAPGAPAAALTAKADAPFDPTGRWVSLVTRDWQYRMVVPGRGEYQGIPLNLAGKQHADAWDAKADEKSGHQCAAYGAGVVMLVPERLHIEWLDEDTLRVETDAGMQTRTLRFRPEAGSASAPASWQGQSKAAWLLHAASEPPGLGGQVANEGHFGALKITTDNMLAGLIRKNGVAYSEHSSLTEYWDVQQDPITKTEYLIVTASLHDPDLLITNYNYVATFERENDGSKWDPTPCSLTTAP